MLFVRSPNSRQRVTLLAVYYNLECLQPRRRLAIQLYVNAAALEPARMRRTSDWRFVGVAVTRWSRSTQLLYIEPG